MTIEDFELWQDDKYFCVTYASEVDGSIESGTTLRTSCFNSAETRAYYISACIYQTKCFRLEAELKAARFVISGMQSRPGVWHKLVRAILRCLRSA